QRSTARRPRGVRVRERCLASRPPTAACPDGSDALELVDIENPWDSIYDTGRVVTDFHVTE
ncbi:MAG: hypothetical protein ACOCUA_01880, partial [archaeon]